jgi:hypothetical protein
LQGLLPLDKAQLGPDIVAGITLAALGIPEVMGYTKIIGTPIITGLYWTLHTLPASGRLRHLRLFPPVSRQCRLGNGSNGRC